MESNKRITLEAQFWGDSILAKFILSILFFSVVLGCNKPEDRSCYKRNGNEVKVIENLPPFSAIEIYGDLDVILVQDTAEFAEILGGENVVPFVHFENHDSILYINDMNKCKWIRGYKSIPKVELHFKDLNLITHSNSGTISNLDTITTDSLYVFIHEAGGELNLVVKTEVLENVYNKGVSKVNISGTTNRLKIFNNGTGTTHCENLYANTVWLTSMGSGDTYVRFSNRMEAFMDYIANVYYIGDSLKIDIFQKGSGAILPAI